MKNKKPIMGLLHPPYQETGMSASAETRGGLFVSQVAVLFLERLSIRFR